MSSTVLISPPELDPWVPTEPFATQSATSMVLLDWVLASRSTCNSQQRLSSRDLLLLSPSLPLGPLARPFVPDHSAIRDLGVALAGLGISLMIWARRHLGHYWSDKVEIKANHQLISTGPYARLRHPIYTGMLLGIAGTALAVGEWRGLAAFVLLLTNYVIKASKEERILRQKFGPAFQEYERRTGFLIPRLRMP